MAKKSSAARNSSAARRSQTTKPQKATLVRASDSGESVATVTAPTQSTPAPKPAARAVTATKPTAAAKPAARPASAPAPRSVGGREQAAKMARARATQRARAANLIVPENFKYVVHDLRLTGALAVLMFAVIIVLHFVLSS